MNLSLSSENEGTAFSAIFSSILSVILLEWTNYLTFDENDDEDDYWCRIFQMGPFPFIGSYCSILHLVINAQKIIFFSKSLLCRYPIWIREIFQSAFILWNFLLTASSIAHRIGYNIPITMGTFLFDYFPPIHGYFSPCCSRMYELYYIPANGRWDVLDYFDSSELSSGDSSMRCKQQMQVREFQYFIHTLRNERTS